MRKLILVFFLLTRNDMIIQFLLFYSSGLLFRTDVPLYFSKNENDKFISFNQHQQRIHSPICIAIQYNLNAIGMILIFYMKNTYKFKIFLLYSIESECKRLILIQSGEYNKILIWQLYVLSIQFSSLQVGLNPLKFAGKRQHWKFFYFHFIFT